MVCRDPILQGMWPPRVLGHIAADRRDHLAGWVWSIVEIVFLRRLSQLKIHNARLDDSQTVFQVQLQDLIHSGELENDPSFHGNSTATQARARATRQKWDFAL